MATTKTFARRQLTYSNATSITAREAAPPFPKTFGLTGITRANASLRARFVAELAKSRPRTRLFSRVAASTPHPVGGAITHGSHSSWLLRASSPSHHSFRQRSTATQRNVQREPSQKKIKLTNQPEPSPRLDTARRLVLNLTIHQEQNVFITGPARSGKSCLLREFVEVLEAKYSREKVVVTASTGIAHSIGGTIIHDFTSSGIKELIAHIHEHPTKLQRWRKVKVLVVDDISMIPAKLLDTLDEVARKVRMDDRPFGGIQLILGGDFCQIPPAVKEEDGGEPNFCFQAESWRKAMLHTVGLTEVFGEDPSFANMLRDIWQGIVSKQTKSTLKQLDKPPKSPGGDKGPGPVQLLSRRDKADHENTRRLNLIERTAHTYVAEEGGTVTDPDTRAKLLSSCPAPGVLDLKEGAQVMLTKDLDYGLVSGSLGRVVGFANEQTFSEQWSGDEGKGKGAQKLRHHKKEKEKLYPVVHFFQKFAGSDHMMTTPPVLCRPAQWTINGQEKLATRTQVPLVLAYALALEQTVGCTVALVNLNLHHGWGGHRLGYAYCALSRATGLETLLLRNFEASKIRAHPDVREFHDSLNLSKGTISHRAPRPWISSDWNPLALQVVEVYDTFQHTNLPRRIRELFEIELKKNHHLTKPYNRIQASLSDVVRKAQKSLFVEYISSRRIVTDPDQSGAQQNLPANEAASEIGPRTESPTSAPPTVEISGPFTFEAPSNTDDDGMTRNEMQQGRSLSDRQWNRNGSG